jgi:hypothetical protein
MLTYSQPLVLSGSATDSFRFVQLELMINKKGFSSTVVAACNEGIF